MTERFELVPFEGRQIMAVERDGEVQVVMKPVAETLGLNWVGQLQRIKRHPVLRRGLGEVSWPTASGMQDMVTLGLEPFHGWLVGISPDRIADLERREAIIRYQARAFRVIFEHFHGRRADTPPPPRPALTGRIGAQNQVLRLMARLREAARPSERAMLHAMLDDLCQGLGLTTPDLETIAAERDLGAPVWWRAWRHLLEGRPAVWRAEGFPTVAQMVRRYLATPHVNGEDGWAALHDRLTRAGLAMVRQRASGRLFLAVAPRSDELARIFADSPFDGRGGALSWAAALRGAPRVEGSPAERLGVLHVEGVPRLSRQKCPLLWLAGQAQIEGVWRPVFDSLEDEAAPPASGRVH